jgi:hypothetical protein
MVSRSAISRSGSVFLTIFGVPGCPALPDKQSIERIEAANEQSNTTPGGFDAIESARC